MKKRWNEISALFFISYAFLSFEISMIRIFNFIHWDNYAFLIINIAMFGMGISGILLDWWSGFFKKNDSLFLLLNSFFASISIFVGLLVANEVAFQYGPFAVNNWWKEFSSFCLVVIFLAMPFFFFGSIISFLLKERADEVNIYYAANLVGSAFGCLLPVFLITKISPQGIVGLSSLLVLTVALLFILSNKGRMALRWAVVVICILLFVFGALKWGISLADYVPLQIHAVKRDFLDDQKQGKIETSKWSVLSRIDVAQIDQSTKHIWIEGGRNSSLMQRFDGDFEKLKSQRQETLKWASMVASSLVLPHLSKSNHTTCVIGTSGGGDSLTALKMGACHVTGVEMDSGIAYLVTVTYKDFTGGLFNDGVYSKLIIDEGRSFLKRSNQKFDVIQQVNNLTPVALQNGALNLSETYLLTVESFDDFYEHLSDDGILAITRWGVVKLLTTAVEMFRRRGITPDEYSKHLVICREKEIECGGTLLLKKSAFTKEEINRVFDFYALGKHDNYVLYAPYRTKDLPDLAHNLYYKIATEGNPGLYWKINNLDFSPPTDSRPFFNRVKTLRKYRNPNLSFLLPEEIQYLKKGRTYSEDSAAIVLGIGLLLLFFFIGMPLCLNKQFRRVLFDNKKEMLYFSCIGMGFIFIELCFIQRFVLFLGAPTYSIALVIFGILISAGLGSFCAQYIRLSRANLRRVLAVLIIVILIFNVGMPLLIRLFLKYVFFTRLLVSLTVVFISGFFMGMPMPLRIRHLKSKDYRLIPLAWAFNNFFTIIGTSLSILIAVNWGFPGVLFTAVLFYGVCFFIV